jgi:hypothetical protein
MAADSTVAPDMVMAAVTDVDGTEVAFAEEPAGSMAEADFTEVVADSTAAVGFMAVQAADSMAVEATVADIANAG